MFDSGSSIGFVLRPRNIILPKEDFLP